MPVETTFDLEALLAALPADTRSQPPSMPIKNLLLEGDDLLSVLSRQKSKFEGLPEFAPNQFALTAFLSKELRSAEGDWADARSDLSGKATKTRTAAMELRRDAMAAGRYLLRKNLDAQSRLDRISEGDGSVADLVDDLKGLAELLSKHASTFAVDERLPEEPEKAALRYAKELSGVKDTADSIQALERRNQIAYLLEGAIAEIRAAARYLFRDDPKMLAKVQSAYRVQKARKTRERKSPAA